MEGRCSRLEGPASTSLVKPLQTNARQPAFKVGQGPATATTVVSSAASSVPATAVAAAAASKPTLASLAGLAIGAGWATFREQLATRAPARVGSESPPRIGACTAAGASAMRTRAAGQITRQACPSGRSAAARLAIARLAGFAPSLPRQVGACCPFRRQ